MDREIDISQSAKLVDRVLIVDQDHEFRSLMRKALQAGLEGVEVLECDSGDKAWSLILNSAITLAVVPAHLSGLPAHELLHRIGLHNLSTKLIVTSEPARAREVVKLIKAGAHDFLERPFSPELLLEDAQEVISLVRKERIELGEAGGDGLRLELIGDSAPMKSIRSLLEQVAPTNSTILVTGESGTGKEVAARSIHRLSKRRNQPFVVVDCGTIPGGLVESELFGYVAGAFTGAAGDKRGLLEQANHGTAFFDEVGEFPLDLQVKLLRVLQDGEIRRLGSDKSVNLDLRVIAATNKELEREVRIGRFRQDLFYRLNVVHVLMPPLRERGDDLELFVMHFLRKYQQEYDHNIQGITRGAMAMLKNYDWPGNIRELEHTLLQVMALHNRKTIIEERDLPMFLERRSHERKRRFLENAIELKLSLDDYAREFIKMFESEFTEKELAKGLGITTKTLWQKRRKWNLQRKKSV